MIWWKSHILPQRVRKRFAMRITQLSQNLDVNVQIIFCSTFSADKRKNEIV